MFLSVPEPFFLANPPKDPMRAHVLTPLRVPKHSPPSPTVETQPGATSPLVAKASPPSPLLSPSEPVAMNSSESASPPSHEVCATHPKQDPLFGRVRVPCGGRNSRGMSPPGMPIGNAPMPPREQSLGRTTAQGSRKRRSQCEDGQSSQHRDARRKAGSSSQPRRGYRKAGKPSQPCGAYREKGKPSQTRDGRRGESSQQDGGSRESAQPWTNFPQQRSGWRHVKFRAKRISCA